VIESLTDVDAFRKRRAAAWADNVDYWLTKPLRHVDDVGSFIVERVISAATRVRKRTPSILDVGFGNAWLLAALEQQRFQCAYTGIDSLQAFVTRARLRHSTNRCAQFLCADIEAPLDIGLHADVVVNAFNFFEVADLSQAMRNTAQHLSGDGTLMISTIDKTYLILALSRDWSEFHENLRRYQELEGTKYAFQPIDEGSRVSNALEYPSVLYSTDDYLRAATANGLALVRHFEHVHTAKLVPKIYLHLEFRRTRSSEA